MTGGRIKRVADYLDDNAPFCLTYGDGLGNVDITASIDFHKKQGRKATMTVVSPPGRFGATVLDGDRVSAFQEKPLGDGARINAGFFVCEKSVLNEIAEDKTVWEAEPLRNLSDQGELSAWRHDGFWQPMDTLREKHMLETLWTEGNAPGRSGNCHAHQRKPAIILVGKARSSDRSYRFQGQLGSMLANADGRRSSWLCVGTRN